VLVPIDSSKLHTPPHGQSATAGVPFINSFLQGPTVLSRGPEPDGKAPMTTCSVKRRDHPFTADITL
jgi:hypothetical protein